METWNRKSKPNHKELPDKNNHLTVINAGEYKRSTLYSREHSNVSMRHVILTSYNICIYRSRSATAVNVLKDFVVIVIKYYKGFNLGWFVIIKI